jgi:ATP-dependent DNA helicase RecQ
VARNGHDRLTTFGIGAELDRGAWLSVHRQLVASGLLEVEAEHGGLRLAASAWPLLRGERTLALRRDLAADALPRGRRARGAAKREAGAAGARRRGGRSVDAVLSFPADRDLFEALRQRRLELARERGLPPYVIFHDSTLLEMVERRPSSRAAMAAVPGVGARKLEEYGDIFLAVIAESSTEGGGIT